MNVRAWSVVLAAAATVGGGAWWKTRRLAATEREASAEAARATSAERAIRVADVGFYEERAASDPESAGDRMQLAALYLQRARETNDYQYYLRAETVARASLALRTQRNSAAYAVLASALLAQHRFADARDAARELVAREPEEDAYRALLGETCLELGDYAAARAAFDAIGSASRTSLDVAPRLARWAEIRGDTAGARVILRRTAAAPDTRELPREQAAWFQLRVADLEMRQGRAGRAERALRDGLAVHPGDARLLGAMAHLAAVRHQWHDAIQYGDSAIAVALDPAALGVVSDAYAALGDTAKAAEYMATMEVAVGQQPGAYHRAWSLFLLDHGRDARGVLARSGRELRVRRDVYGWDVQAWALHALGRDSAAWAAAGRALAQGTEDATLEYHAGVIAQALGRADATAHLARALTINPSFHPTQAADARRRLRSTEPTVAAVVVTEP